MSSVSTSAPTVMLQQPEAAWIRIFGSVSYAVLASCSIALYSVLIYILTKYHRHYRRSAFHIISWQVIVCCFLNQVMQLVLAVPITSTGSAVYGSEVLIWSLSVVDTATYYATVAFTLLMTINRAAVFFFPALNNAIFDVPRIYGSVALTWTLSLASPISITISGCFKSFTTNGIYSYTDCQSSTGKATYQGWTYIKTYCPVLMLLTYVAIYAYLRFLTRNKVTSSTSRGIISEKEKSMRRREMRLLLQSFLICGTLEVENLFFMYIKYLHFDGDWMFFVYFLQNWIKIINGSMTAIILFVFNAEIRTRFFRLFRAGQMSSIQAFTMTPVPSQTARTATKNSRQIVGTSIR